MMSCNSLFNFICYNKKLYYKKKLDNNKKPIMSNRRKEEASFHLLQSRPGSSYSGIYHQPKQYSRETLVRGPTYGQNYSQSTIGPQKSSYSQGMAAIGARTSSYRQGMASAYTASAISSKNSLYSQYHWEESELEKHVSRIAGAQSRIDSKPPNTNSYDLFNIHKLREREMRVRDLDRENRKIVHKISNVVASRHGGVDCWNDDHRKMNSDIGRQRVANKKAIDRENSHILEKIMTVRE